MKVAWIVPGFSADEDDWCIPVLVDVARALSPAVELHVFALRYPPRRARYMAHGARIHALGLDRQGWQRGHLVATALRELIREHRRAPFAAIHGLWCDEPGLLATAAGRILGCVSVVSVMGGELVRLPELAYGGQLSRLNRHMSGLALCGAGRVTVACSSVERLVRETTESRISPQILAWGIDPTVFPAGEPAQRRPELTVLHVGSLHPVKGQSSLLRAFALVRVREPAARLVIAGDGPLRMPLQRLAHELSVGEAVEFLGHVPRERLGALYRSAHVLAVSSAYESQHVATLEAGLHSLPVVSTEVGLPADLAREGAVIAVPVDQPEATADALLRLREPRLAVPMGDRLRQAVQRRFLAGQTARRLLDLYAGQGCEG